MRKFSEHARIHVQSDIGVSKTSKNGRNLGMKIEEMHLEYGKVQLKINRDYGHEKIQLI